MAVDDNQVLKEIAFFMGAVKDILSGPLGRFYEFGRKGPDHTNPETKEWLKTDTAHHVGGMLVLTMFSMRDEELSDPVRQKFENLLKPDEKQRYEALLHIRNTFGHKFGGSRAVRRAADFDAIMAGPKPFTGVIEHTADTIRVNTDIARECQVFLHQITENVFRRYSQQMNDG